MMKINFDNSIIDRFGHGFPRALKSVNEIVIHHTAGDGGFRGLKKWMLSETCERKAQYEKHVGYTHYYIDKDGTVNQIMKNNEWAYHSSSGVHDSQTIGIEVVHKSGPFTDLQYHALIDLIWDIKKECPITQIVSHDYNYWTFSKGKKGCPSKDFDFSKLSKLNLIIKTV